jgi:hypothetical protein
MLVVAAMVLMSSTCWAIFYALPESKDEYGLKYDVVVTEADSNTLNIAFTLEDEGRLKPIYKIDLIAFSKQVDSQGGRSYDVLVPLKFKPTSEGNRVAQAQIKKEFVDRAHFRVLTQMVDGKRQPSGGSYVNIFLKKYWNDGTEAPSPVALPPSTKIKR